MSVRAQKKTIYEIPVAMAAPFPANRGIRREFNKILITPDKAEIRILYCVFLANPIPTALASDIVYMIGYSIINGKMYIA